MKPFHLVVNILFFTVFSTNSFGQSFQWAKQIGGANWDEATSIVTDQNNNVYTVGLFNGTVDFDPGVGVFNLTSVGEKDAFICKLDASGSFVWAKQYGNGGITESSSLGIDSLGNLYTTNSFIGTVDFDPGIDSFVLTSVGWDRDVFIQKLDANGNFIWAKQISGQPLFAFPTPVHSNAIAVDSAGNHYITGYFDGTTDFDPGSDTFNLTAVVYSDIFVSKYDASGNFVWAKQMGGTEGGVGYAIAMDENNNVYSTGTFGGTIDFDPGPNTFNLSPSEPTHSEVYLSKLDALGNFVWAKPLGPGEGSAIAVDEDQNVYASGWVPLGYTPVLSKHDPSGNQIWAKELGGINGNSIAIDNDNNVYTIGYCFGTNDFDPGPDVFNLSGGNSDSFISKLNSSGDFLWAGLLTTTSQVWIKSITVNMNNEVYTTGYFDGTADFDPNPSTVHNLSTPQYSYNVFVLKLEPNLGVGLSENNYEEEIRVYPNPTDGNLVIKLDREYDDLDLVIRNALGQVVNTKFIGTGKRAELQINEESGLYFLEIYDQENLKTVLKIIKK